MKSNLTKSPTRRTAIIVGVLYILGMVVGIAGHMIVQSVIAIPDHLAGISTSTLALGVGVLLWLIAVVGDAMHGVLMLPILRPHNERLAYGYLAARIIDAAFVAFMALFILLQIPVGAEFARVGASGGTYLSSLSTVFSEAQRYSYELGMMSVGFAGLMLNFVFYRAGLLPKFIAIWGLVGYASFLVGSSLEILGFNMMLMHTVIGGLWELLVGGWLITKGFRTPRIPSTGTENINYEPSLVV